MGADVEAQLRLRGRAVQGVARLAGVHERAEQVEAGRHAERPPDGAHELHPVGEQRGVEVAHAGLVQRAAQHVRVVAELGAVGLQDRAGAAHGGAGAVAVLGDLVAGAGDHEGRAGGDVEGVLAVAAGAHDVEGVGVADVDVAAGLQQAVAEAEQLVHGHAAGLQGHQQGCDLAVVVLFAGDAEHQFVGLFAGEALAFDELVQILFHILLTINDSTSWIGCAPRPG